MREEGVADLEFAHTSAVRRNLSVPPAQKKTEEVGRMAGNVVCREPLGGMLRYYYREAFRTGSILECRQNAA